MGVYRISRKGKDGTTPRGATPYRLLLGTVQARCREAEGRRSQAPGREPLSTGLSLCLDNSMRNISDDSSFLFKKVLVMMVVMMFGYKLGKWASPHP